MEGWRGGGVVVLIGIASSLARLDARAQSPYHTRSLDNEGADSSLGPNREGADARSMAVAPSSGVVERIDGHGKSEGRG